MVRDVKELYSKVAKSGPPTPGGKPLQHGSETVVTYNFDQGLAAAETFPLADFVSIAKRIVARDGPTVLEYKDRAGPPDELVYGYLGLREQIAARIRKLDGRELGPDGVILTSGSVQAIAMAINGFLGPGDGAVVEGPSFPYAIRYMHASGAEVRAVPIDEDGMDLDAVEDRLREFKAAGIRPKMIYSIPTFQLPTGTCMSLERRKRLIRLAKKWQVMVLEDNVYGELRFEGKRLPSLLGLDDSGLVMQADGFSKTVVPGLRLGWLAGHPEAVAGAANTRQDLGVSQWMARLMEEYMDEGKLEPHIERASAVYHRKRDKAMAALGEYCGPWVRYRVPQGAFYLWLELADEVDGPKVKEIAARQGVLCRPGEMFFGDESGKQHLRLAYSAVSEEEIDRGIAVLGQAIAESMR